MREVGPRVTFGCRIGRNCLRTMRVRRLNRQPSLFFPPATAATAAAVAAALCVGVVGRIHGCIKYCYFQSHKIGVLVVFLCNTA